MNTCGMKLFKYLSENRTSFLDDGLIRFTQPHAFNDPFELKPSVSAFCTEQYIKESLNLSFSKIIAEQYLELPVEVRCIITPETFSAIAESRKSEVFEGVKNMAIDVTPLAEKMLHDGFEKHVGVLSLTESPNNLLMWAHYANSHQGFVVEFEPSHMFFDQRKTEKDDLRHIRKIQYAGSRPQHVLTEVQNMGEFLIKSTDWAYEQEWRMLAALADADVRIEETPNDIYLFRLPFDAIKSVRIGARASAQTRECVISLLRKNPELSHVAIFEMQIDSERFELHEKRII